MKRTRLLISYDNGKIWLRETLCITHGDTEAIYHAQPAKWTRSRINALKKALNKKLKGLKK